VPDNRPPVTIRITRPYGSENEFIDGDLAWIGRSTIVLADSPARKTGEVIRFEVVLKTGSPVFRGEGSVVAHNLPGSGKPPGLGVRFTRIDARSKLILDQIRERRAALSRSGENPAATPVAAPPEATPVAAPPEAVAPAASPAATAAAPAVTTEIQPPIRAASERRVVDRANPPSKVAAPSNRDEILERLRSRAKHLAEQGGFSFKKRQGAP